MRGNNWMEQLIIAIIGGIISGIIVGIFLLCFSKIKWNLIFYKRRIKRVLKKYLEIRNNRNKERKIRINFGELIDVAHKKLQKMGFSIANQGNLIKNKKFAIYLLRMSDTTEFKQSKYIKRFYIHKLDNGRPYKPNIIFYSEEFSEESKEISKDQVIHDFIKYLKKK